MNKFRDEIFIDGKAIGFESPTYFIADIAANHDGLLSRALDLIRLAAASGADAAKFQHFQAHTIVSDEGFTKLGGKFSHQAKWTKSVYQTYEAASLPPEWTESLKSECAKCGITFLTTPYSFSLADHVDDYVEAFKIGSGDITWIDFIEYVADKKKPVLLATGAADMVDVLRAVSAINQKNDQLVLMQCNTNYTASEDNFRYLNLNVLKTYQAQFPGLILGLSDHTLGHSSVLGAVALGARVIEKHFTDDPTRLGPDHSFSMTPLTWRRMVEATRELEASLGGLLKRVEPNELDTVVLQRRAVWAARDIAEGDLVERDALICLRPCPSDAIPANRLCDVIGRRLKHAVGAGEALRPDDLE